MQNEKLQKILINIGLSGNEAQVYLTALMLGPTTVLALARATDIKRTTVYGIVEDLKQQGLMRVELKGLKTIYQAENPEKLEQVLLDRHDEFKKKLPDFLSIYNFKETETSIKRYEGLKALKHIYYESLKDIKHNEEYLVITNQEQWYNLDPDFAMDYIEKRAKLPFKIKTRLLFQDSPVAQEHKRFERNFNEQIKILPADTKLNVDALILPHKLIITQTVAPITILVIENQSMVNMQKTMFDLIWGCV